MRFDLVQRIDTTQLVYASLRHRIFLPYHHAVISPRPTSFHPIHQSNEFGTVTKSHHELYQQWKQLFGSHLLHRSIQLNIAQPICGALVVQAAPTDPPRHSHPRRLRDRQGSRGARLRVPQRGDIQRAAEVLQSLRGRMPDGSDGQVAACDYCRRRKIRCDRIKPTCGSCTASGRKCTTEDMLRKRGPPSKKERAILEAAGIIFRGTRPHRRRRTATTSLGSVPPASSRKRCCARSRRLRHTHARQLDQLGRERRCRRHRCRCL